MESLVKTMLRRVRIHLFTLTFLLSAAMVPALAHAQLSTTDLNTLTPTDLVNTLLGGGVTVSNVTYTGANVAAGTFTGGTGIIGIESGIILSSGNIASIVGPNSEDGMSTNNGTPGDTDLEGLIPGYFTYDACVLEFDFIPVGNEVTFQYVFVSEEYNEFANTSYNDVFGFFVNRVNYALLPDGVTRVSINNVNGGNPFGENAKNPEFYINNDCDDGPCSINIQADGLTVVLTLIAPVTANQENHIKLAISDAGDSALNSWVFIKAESFKVPEDCTNGIDDDGDGLVDCNDPDCAAYPGCLPVEYTLTVTKAGTGAGTVTSNPAGINCGADCVEVYNEGTAVTLTATPDADSTFTGWSGDTSDGQVTMDADKNCTATFTINTYTVTPSAGAGGSISPSTPQTVNHGETIAFTVTPDTGYHIDTVTGCGGTLTGNTYTTGPITADCDVTATFALYQYTLTVTKAGTGSGTVTSSPAGISCGADCSEAYDYNISVTLTAMPDAGSIFTGWSGDTSEGQVTMDADKNCTATFAINTHTVTPSAGAGGSISPSTPQTVNHGETIAFTVTPDTGYHIDTVTGCGGTLTGNTYTTGAITADCAVTAAFAINTHTVTPSAGAGGIISPSTPQTVNHGATTAFTITPNTGYHINTVTGCGGTLTGNTYTTGPITADCDVTATFSAVVSTYSHFIEGGTEIADYHMFSTPFWPVDGSPDVVLSDLWWPYEGSKWRLFSYEGGEYHEYPSVPDFSPGLAYWLITTEDVTLNVEGTLVDTAENFTLSIEPEWNMVGNPFLSSISTTSLFEVNPGISKVCWSYEGGEYVMAESLAPWKGYWIYNLEASDLVFPASSSLSSASTARNRFLSFSLSPEEGWSLRIMAKRDDFKDTYNFIGLCKDSSIQYDSRDLFEPPLISQEQLRLYFSHKNWLENPGLYATDFRPPGKDKETFKFVVEAGKENQRVILSWSGVKEAPSEYKLILKDLKKRRRINMRRRESYTFDSGSEEGRKFQIILQK